MSSLRKTFSSINHSTNDRLDSIHLNEHQNSCHDSPVEPCEMGCCKKKFCPLQREESKFISSTYKNAGLCNNCLCDKNLQYHRIVSLHSDAQSSCSSELNKSVASQKSVKSRSKSNKSNLDISLKNASERIFDSKSVKSFAKQIM